MKKRLIAFVLVSFLLLISLAAAQSGVKIYPEEKELVVNIGETKKLAVNIENDQSGDDTFSLTVFPQFLKGVSVEFDEKIVIIKSNTNKTASLTFVVSKLLCTSHIDQTFTLYATSRDNTDVSASEKVILTIPGKGLCISDIKFEKDKNILEPEEKTKIKIDVTNANDKLFLQYVVQANVKKDEIVLKRFEKVLNLAEKSKSEVEFDYSPEKYMEPGKYQIEVLLKDNIGTTIDSQIFYFNISATSKPPTIKKSVFYGVLFSRVTVTIKNENNIPLQPFLYIESVPEFTKDVITPVTKTTSVETANNIIIYSWLIETMKAGEERLLTYEFRMQNIVALTILIFIIVLLAFNYVFTPKIVKKSKTVRGVTGEKEIEVSIDVRNRTRHAMHKVAVTDFVPGIVNLVGRFGTLKPLAEKKPNGVQLTWNFESLAPFEERVLTYRIKPKVEVTGMVKLPNAHIRFFDKKMKGKVILSKSILVK